MVVVLSGVLSCGGGGGEIWRTSFGIGGGRRIGLLLFVLLLVSMFEFKALQHSGSLLPIGRSEATILYTLVALSRVTFLLKRCLCQRI